MLSLIKSKHFYIITTCVLLAGIIVFSFLTYISITTGDKAAQLLVDNGISLNKVYEDKEKIEEFTKSSKVATDENTTVVKRDTRSASESNLFALITKYCNTLYSYNQDINTYVKSQNELKSVVTKDIYSAEEKKLKNIYQNISHDYSAIGFIDFAYFKNLDTTTPEGYVKIGCHYKYNDGGEDEVTFRGKMFFTFDEKNNTWVISKNTLVKE